VGDWRARNGALLEAATKAALLGLIAYGLVRRPAWRNLTVAALLVLVHCGLTRPTRPSSWPPGPATACRTPCSGS
jgi:hypothetical protein